MWRRRAEREKLTGMFAGVTDVLWTVGTIALLIGMLWLARRIDPHWVAKDGRAFTCRFQPIRLPGASASDGSDRRAILNEGRWRTGRAIVTDDQVIVSSRRMPAGQRPHRHAVIGRGTDPPKRQVTFLLDGDPNYLLIVPASSRAVAVLDSVVRR